MPPVSSALSGALLACITTGLSVASADPIQVIGATLRVYNDAGQGQATVQATFLGDASSLFTQELFLDGPTFQGPIFNSKQTPVGATAFLGSFQPETVLFIRNQSFFIPNPGGPASYNFGFFTGDGTLPLNPDRLAHAVFTFDPDDLGSDVTVSFEDQFGGGDYDFNDAVYSFTNVRVGFVDVALTPNFNNPAGNTVTTDDGDENAFASYNESYSNEGEINNGGRLINYGTGSNSGTVANDNLWFNDLIGVLTNEANGLITNSESGTIRSFGIVENLGTIETSGALDNFGTLDNLAAIVNTGELANGFAADLTNTLSGSISNHGQVTNAGDLQNSGTLENGSDGTVQNDGALTSDGQIVNDGALVNSSGGTLIFGGGGPFGITTSRGLIKNLGIMNVDLGAAVETLAEGLLENSGTGFVQVLGELSNLGSLANLGQIANGGTLTNGGAMSNLMTLANSGALDNLSGALFTNAGTTTNEAGGTVNNAGTMETTGTLENAGAIENSGTLHFGGGGPFGITTSTGLIKNLGIMNVDLGAAVETLAEGLLENSGTGFVQVLGQLSNLGSLANLGQIANGGTLTNGGAMSNLMTLANSGALDNLSGAMLTNAGTTTNEAGGTVNNAGTVENAGTVANSGNIINVAGGIVRNLGQISNAGTVSIESGANVSGTGTYTQSAGLTRVDGSLGGRVVDILGGELSGSGTIDSSLNVQDGGELRPGNSPGTLTITGDLLSNGGDLYIELVSPDVHDLLAIDGTALLDGGTINYSFLETPEAGDVFTWLVASAGLTIGAAPIISMVGGGTGLVFETTFTTDRVLLSVSQVPLPASIWLLGSAVASLVLRRHTANRTSHQRPSSVW